MNKYLNLFLTFLKIGAFTFGGGTAMIPLLKEEFVDKKKWIDEEEFKNIVIVAESTPGPIAVNSSTYIGYKVSGFFGALISTNVPQDAWEFFEHEDYVSVGDVYIEDGIKYELQLKEAENL